MNKKKSLHHNTDSALMKLCKQSMLPDEEIIVKRSFYFMPPQVFWTAQKCETEEEIFHRSAAENVQTFSKQPLKAATTGMFHMSKSTE